MGYAAVLHQVAGVQQEVGCEVLDARHHRLMDLMLRAGVPEGDEGELVLVEAGGGAEGRVLAQGRAAAFDVVVVDCVRFEVGECDGVAQTRRCIVHTPGDRLRLAVGDFPEAGQVCLPNHGDRAGRDGLEIGAADQGDVRRRGERGGRRDGRMARWRHRRSNMG